ncbi:MAG: o-succinylbenzoate synthase, partial [Actinomycetota bacterium]
MTGREPATIRDGVRRYRIPFRLPFRGLTHREGVLYEGPRGWAECSPFPWYRDDEVDAWRRAAEEAAFEPWPHRVRERVPVNATVPAVDAHVAHAIAASSGCSTVKVKVGDPGDTERVEAVRSALGPRGRIRLDANGAWDVDTATHRIGAFARYDLEYVEQPVRTLEEMATLRKRIEVLLAVDEPARSVAGARRAGELEAADVLIVKVQPVGGVRAGMRAAEVSGLPAVVSSAVETSIGLAAGVALAAALPELPYACGLGTLSLLEGDVTADPLVPVDGAIAVRRPAVDERELAR